VLILGLTAILSCHLLKDVNSRVACSVYFFVNFIQVLKAYLIFCFMTLESLFLCLECRSQTCRGWTLRHSKNKKKKQSTRCWYLVTSTIFPLKTCQPSSRNKAAPYLKRLVAGFPPRRPGFKPGSSHVGFVVDKVALEQVFSEYFGFPCLPIFLFHNHHHLSSGAGTIGQ
jgi:hypothetical protein